MKVEDFTKQFAPGNVDCEGCYFIRKCTRPTEDGFETIDIVNKLDEKYGNCACSHVYVKINGSKLWKLSQLLQRAWRWLACA